MNFKGDQKYWILPGIFLLQKKKRLKEKEKKKSDA